MGDLVEKAVIATTMNAPTMAVLIHSTGPLAF